MGPLQCMQQPLRYDNNVAHDPKTQCISRNLHILRSISGLRFRPSGIIYISYYDMRSSSSFLTVQDRHPRIRTQTGSPTICCGHSIEPSFEDSPIASHNVGAPAETCLLCTSGILQPYGYVLESNDANDGLWRNHGLRDAIYHGTFGMDEC
jgi:hypothetical protein